MTKRSKKEKKELKSSYWFSKIIGVTAGAGLLVFCICLILGMFGYNPGDESFNVSNSEKISNFMGRFGSYSSDFIVNSFGLAIFVFLIPVAIWGFLLIKNQKILEFKIRLLAVLIGIISLAGVFYQLFAAPLESVNLLGKFSPLLPNVLTNLFESWNMQGYEKTAALALQITIALMSFNLAVGITFKQWGRILKGLGRSIIIAFKGIGKFIARLFKPKALVYYSDNAPTKQSKVRKEPVLSAPIEEALQAENVVPISQIEEKPGKKAKVSKQKTAEIISITPQVNKEENGYKFPDINLLSRPKERLGLSVNEKELNETARTLEAVLEEFGVHGQIVKIRPGPVVTLFELEPAPGTKTSRVISLADDIARSMFAVSVRIAVVPGSNTIGIEIPNSKRETVWLRDLLEDVDFTDSKNALNVVLGKDIGGKNIYADLAKMPHLLVAGTTGSGKSVGVNAMILSLLYRMTPEECKFILIDPKMLEFSMYNGIPHLLTPVITDPAKAVIGLKWAVREMEERYRAMACLSVRNINGYNLKLKELREKGETPKRTIQVGFDPETGKPEYEEQLLDTKPLPYIVIVVDEMADLMLVAGKEVEAAIQRLAQMARAAGIHLIMSTQRPSVDVITGTIKSNFPTRISFQVTSKIDSRTILGEQGAEQLLGKGDMLYMPAGLRPQRIHGGFVKDEEVESVVEFIKSQRQPEYVDEVTAGELEMKNKEAGALFDRTSMGMSAGNSNDDLYEQAVQIVRNDKKASTSYIQRRLGIGYNKAATIIERMEAEGVVTAADHVGRREVI
ncbi:MAG: DNA translocase FtsK 4TM domain-containing protein [Alphaproteobacteria bacterium]|nr:DNA translocase FtsK 4TM domain-containing protein [Alphaproteobacteria bacterium]